MQNELARKYSSEFKVDRSRHEGAITVIKSRLESLFKKLIKNNTMQSCILSKDNYDGRFQICRLQYACEIPYHYSKEISFHFEINLQRKEMTVVEVKQSATFAKFTISKVFDHVMLQRMISKRIQQWVRGAKLEYLFFNKLLKPLLSLPCRRISRVYHVNNRKDKFSGIDFVIHFLVKPDYSEEKVEFNLKSSDRYIEKHTKKYPNISTFICLPEHFSDITRLRKRFFKFACIARHTVCHH